MLRRFPHARKPIVVAILLVSVLCAFVTHVSADSHSHVAWDLLPHIGSLDILPSGPSSWVAVIEVSGEACDALLAAVAPRGPPV